MEVTIYVKLSVSHNSLVMWMSQLKRVAYCRNLRSDILKKLQTKSFQIQTNKQEGNFFQSSNVRALIDFLVLTSAHKLDHEGLH